MRAILCLVLLVTALAKQPATNAPNASFNSKGGEFGISTNGVWMSLQWATIAEVDSEGKAVQSYDLSGHHFGWSQPEVGDLVDDKKRPTGNHFPAVNFTEQLENGAWFNVSAWIIDSNATNASLKRNSVKFSIYISNWTFIGAGGENPATSLAVTAGLVGFGGLVRRESNKENHSSTAVYGSGFLDAPTEALYDGETYGEVKVEHTLKGKPIVIFTFEQFYDNVSYDPTFGPGNGSENGGTSMKPSFFILPLFLFSFFFFKQS